MPIQSFRPITPTLRFQTKLVNDDITTNEPYKPLLTVKPRTGGRNSSGRMTIRHQGGGHKQKLRLIDFKRDKYGIPAVVETIEYDPNRSSRIALVSYADGEKRYIIQPVGLKVGQSVMSGPEADILVGNALPLKNIPLGTIVHNIELRPGKGAQMARSAGAQGWPGRQGGRLCLAQASLRRDEACTGRVHGDDRSGWQHGSRECNDRQGGEESLEGDSAGEPWCLDEPGGSPAWRR